MNAETTKIMAEEIIKLSQRIKKLEGGEQDEKVYLFCSAGMSTSILASKMQEVANSHNLPIKVAAFSHNKLGEIVKSDCPDCILLGPQVEYLYDETVANLDT